MVELQNIIKQKQSLLCVGLDFELDSYSNPMDICKTIINQTIDYSVMYKINLAFFEFCNLEVKTIVDYCHNLGAKVIIDGKRGDIGNSSKIYSNVMYDIWNSDGATLNPYMGLESLKPFLDKKDKLSIILGLTSNESEFQRLKLESGKELWEEIIHQSLTWENSSELWYVMGANRTLEIKSLRERGIDNWFLIPGVGHQGGDLKSVLNVSGGRCIVNVSRSIINSNNPKQICFELQSQMKDYV
jgi:orotidine-5'-phosphate decarboxylase